jgi:hypothetical protein
MYIIVLPDDYFECHETRANVRTLNLKCSIVAATVLVCVVVLPSAFFECHETSAEMRLLASVVAH